MSQPAGGGVVYTIERAILDQILLSLHAMLCTWRKYKLPKDGLENEPRLLFSCEEQLIFLHVIHRSVL